LQTIFLYDNVKKHEPHDAPHVRPSTLYPETMSSCEVFTMATQQKDLGSASKSIPHVVPGFLNRFAPVPKETQPQPKREEKRRTQTVPSVAAMRRCRHDGELGFD
jgi:hypothetical protein